MRSEAPAQWTVEPPTDLTIQAGRPGKSLATRQVPDVVRLSSHEILRNMPHSSLLKSAISVRLPASRQTTLMPFWASSLESVPPPAPEPTTTTTLSSVRLYATMIAPSSGLQPVDVVEAAMDVAALRGGGSLVAEPRPHSG